MIHIATTHFRDTGWIDLQLRHLERHTKEPYLTYASLEQIDARQRSRFDWTMDHTGRIPSRKPGVLGPGLEACLNELAGEIIRRADPGDLLVFMHSDALPIADWVAPSRRTLAEVPLAAIRRDENYEPVPHWSFCVTTAGFWSEVGDWSRGPTWDDGLRRASDTGALLWQRLERRGIAWHPLLRTNKVDLHPVLFGVYGDLVYHHGTGSRTPMTRRDARGYAHLAAPLRKVAGVRRRIANTRLSRRMLRKIRRDERFYLELTGGPV